MGSNGWNRLESGPKMGSTPQKRPGMPAQPRMESRQPQRQMPAGKPPGGMARPQPRTAAPPQPRMAPAPPTGTPPAQGGKGIHSQTVGERGPVLAQDTVLYETLEDFVNSTTLGRVVHTKGFGAFGYFQCTQSMAEYTQASLFQGGGQQVPVAVRFSLAVSNPGTPDTGRNVRGFSTKFYTGDRVFDLLCNHIPVFLVRDAIRFPDSIRAFQASPVNNLIDPNRFWGFVATAPEATNFVTWLYSDLGTIKSLRKIRAYSVNTYVWRNAQGVRRYVKYHWIPLAGEEHIDAQEAGQLAGSNPDIAGQDLYDTIAAGTPVEYELRVQIMNPEDAAALPYDPLDDTKVWDEQQYPLLPVGRMVLNRNPENYAEQIEKLAFAPSNLLEGIEFSDDKMLQGRSFIYPDAQRHRLGDEFRKIPINRQENWKPGDMISSGNGRPLDGVVQRSDLPRQDDFAQAGERYRSLSPEEQDHLVRNIAGDLAGAKTETQRIVLGYLHNASQEMANRIAEEMRGKQA